MSVCSCCHRSISGSLTSPVIDSAVSTSNCLYVLCTTMKRATITSTSKQEVKAFHFYTDTKIGMEVEVSFGRVYALLHLTR
jgi:hypothetical protein